MRVGSYAHVKQLRHSRMRGTRRSGIHFTATTRREMDSGQPLRGFRNDAVILLDTPSSSRGALSRPVDAASRPRSKEGAGNAGATSAPAASCAKIKAHE